MQVTCFNVCQSACRLGFKLSATSGRASASPSDPLPARICKPCAVQAQSRARLLSYRCTRSDGGLRPAASSDKLSRVCTSPSARRRRAAAHNLTEGDVVLLKDKKTASHEGLLVKLEATKHISTHRGKLAHADIIGKEPRQLVHSTRGNAYRIHEPTLAEYVRLTRRLVTPVRPLHRTRSNAFKTSEACLTWARFTLPMRT